MWCNCEDYPCCGHGPNGDRDVESAEDFLSDKTEEELEFVERTMRPCPECGEYRPKNDESMKRHGMCHMCHEDPQRVKSPTAGANIAYFSERQRADREHIMTLEEENQRLRADNERLRGEDGQTG